MNEVQFASRVTFHLHCHGRYASCVCGSAHRPQLILSVVRFPEQQRDSKHLILESLSCLFAWARAHVSIGVVSVGGRRMIEFRIELIDTFQAHFTYVFDLELLE